jgi:hypothetical protein
MQVPAFIAARIFCGLCDFKKIMGGSHRPDALGCLSQRKINRWRDRLRLERENLVGFGVCWFGIFCYALILARHDVPQSLHPSKPVQARSWWTWAESNRRPNAQPRSVHMLLCLAAISSPEAYETRQYETGAFTLHQNAFWYKLFLDSENRHARNLAGRNDSMLMSRRRMRPRNFQPHQITNGISFLDHRRQLRAHRTRKSTLRPMRPLLECLTFAEPLFTTALALEHFWESENPTRTLGGRSLNKSVPRPSVSTSRFKISRPSRAKSRYVENNGVEITSSTIRGWPSAG